MRNQKEIRSIIHRMPTDLMKKIIDAEARIWNPDEETAKKARAEFLQNLAKAGLTVAEWDAWMN
jgi:hypothetical protein